MFRVLSDEESKRVTRWKAPELANNETGVVNTRQNARPESAQSGANVKTLLGSLDLKPGHANTQTAPPRLQSLSSANVLAGQAKAHQAGSGNSLGMVSTVSAELLQASYDEGYATGYKDGYASLHQQSVEELRHIAAMLHNASMNRIDSDLEKEVIALTLDIARLVIGREVSIDDTLMRNIVSAGLDQLPGSSDTPANVYLNPLDANTVREYLHDESGLRVLDDISLARGACRIESGSSTVNSGVEDWLASVSVQLGLTATPANGAADESAQTSGHEDSTVASNET